MNNRIRSRASRALSLLLLVAVSWQATAETHPDVEAAFLKYAEAMKIYDSQQMTSFMHPEAMNRFRTTIDRALNGPKKDQAATELLPLFAVSSAEEFAQLSDAEAFKRLNDTVGKSSAELLEVLSQSTFEVVGVTMKDDLAYLNYNLKMTIEGKEINSQVVQTLKLHEGNWLLMLPSTSEASIAGIEKRFN